MGELVELDVRAVTRDDVAPFDAFFTATYPALAGYCESLVGADRADEVAQEAMTRVYARWPLLREPRPYVFRVATNVVRDEWRRTARERELWAATAERRPAAAPDPEIWDLVHRLPERLRDVVLLHYLADLPVAEVATAVRRPVGTVKRRLHEARQALAIALEDQS